MLFKDVLVEDSLKKRLITLVKENRVSHAQLILGAPGTHKFALAVAYAQYLCCENRGEEDSCGVCPSCKKFAKIAHPDLHLIFPNAATDDHKKDYESRYFTREFVDFVEKSNYHLDFNKWLDVWGGGNKKITINIRDCASIINQNSIKAYEGGYKIYILWKVDELYHDAAPKLLKTLEEPENKTLFLLIADDTDKILPTILSRTQLIKVPSMSNELITKELTTHYGATAQVAKEIAEISDGNFIKALNLLEEGSELHEMIVLFQFMLESAIACKSGDINSMKYAELRTKIADLCTQSQDKQKMFYTHLIQSFRNMLLLNNNNSTLVKATTEELTFLNQYKKYINLKNITPILDECNKAILHITRNGNPTLIHTDFYLKLAGLI
ncbi:MAG: hypothetical protein MJZ76_05010 [Bacteroidales bacterium]|nr:hypothetical protein [Bacteroidales bacterium]